MKGGRRFGFAALVVVGDQKGRVGFGHGKAREVPEAIRKATEEAKRDLICVPLRAGRTLHHDVEGRWGAGKVLLRAAKAGTGIIAGGPMRAVFETLGVQDVVAKSMGSSNPYNMVRATFDALKSQMHPKDVAAAARHQVLDAPGTPRQRGRGRRVVDGQGSATMAKKADQDRDRRADRQPDPPAEGPARDAGRPRPEQDAPAAARWRTRLRCAA